MENIDNTGEGIRIKRKNVRSFLAAYREGNGKLADFNKDMDLIYKSIYDNGLQDMINGAPVGIFYTEFGGRYIAAVPLKEKLILEDGIETSEIPGEEVVSLIHKGSGDSIEQSFDFLKEYFREKGLKWKFPVREIYTQVSGPEEDQSIEIQVPFEDSETPSGVQEPAMQASSE